MIKSSVMKGKLEPANSMEWSNTLKIDLKWQKLESLSEMSQFSYREKLQLAIFAMSATAPFYISPDP